LETKNSEKGLGLGIENSRNRNQVFWNICQASSPNVFCAFSGEIKDDISMKNAEQFLHAPSINYLIGRWLTNITLQKRSLSKICLNIVGGNVVVGR
jgi:hypothetical protein